MGSCGLPCTALFFIHETCSDYLDNMSGQCSNPCGRLIYVGLPRLLQNVWAYDATTLTLRGSGI